MKKLISLLLLSLLFTCGELIDKPKNLIDRETMSIIIAEFAINEQLGSVTQDLNLETATRYTLKKHKIKGSDFAASYEYYTATKELLPILEEAQNIILNKDPKARPYLDKKIKENLEAPAISN